MDRIDNLPGTGGIVTLDRDWQGAPPGLIWLIPPPDTAAKMRTLEVYQRIMKF